MSELSLDEYHLMMGTQMWIKEAFFDFLSELFGSKKDSKGGSQIDKVMQDLEKSTQKYSDKSSVHAKQALSKFKQKMNEAKHGSEKQESQFNKTFENLEKNQQTVDVNKKTDAKGQKSSGQWSIFVNDYTQKRDGKMGKVQEKIKIYTEKKYL